MKQNSGYLIVMGQEHGNNPEIQLHLRILSIDIFLDEYIFNFIQSTIVHISCSMYCVFHIILYDCMALNFIIKG